MPSFRLRGLLPVNRVRQSTPVMLAQESTTVSLLSGWMYRCEDLYDKNRCKRAIKIMRRHFGEIGNQEYGRLLEAGATGAGKHVNSKKYQYVALPPRSL